MNEFYTDRFGYPSKFESFFGENNTESTDVPPASNLPDSDRAAKVARRFNRRVIGIGILAAAVTMGATYVLSRLDESQGRYLDKVEACVSHEVGRPVTLATHPDSLDILESPELVDEIEKCKS